MRRSAEQRPLALACQVACREVVWRKTSARALPSLNRSERAEQNTRREQMIGWLVERQVAAGWGLSGYGSALVWGEKEEEWNYEEKVKNVKYGEYGDCLVDFLRLLEDSVWTLLKGLENNFVSFVANSLVRIRTKWIRYPAYSIGLWTAYMI